MDGPYFSLKNLAFQTPGSDIERQINRDKAVDVLTKYVQGSGYPQDAAVALQYLAATYSKLAQPCDQITKSFALDGFLERELKDAMCIPALRLIRKRLGITNT